MLYADICGPEGNANDGYIEHLQRENCDYGRNGDR